MTNQPPQFGERASYGPNDVCYRHADRPSFTLCQRCGNTVCQDCQFSKQIGLLCGDCAKELEPSGKQRAKRSALAIVRRGSQSSAPVATYTIMAICLVVWLTQVSLRTTSGLWYAPIYSDPEHFQPWRMFTAMFAHLDTSMFHILFNMYALWAFGRELEFVLGRSVYIGFYLLSGIGGSVAVQLWGYTSPDAFTSPTVGASGAIFGVLGATLVLFYKFQQNFTSLLILLAINLVIGFLPGTTIAWQAHVGGLLVGALLGLLLYRKQDQRPREQQFMVLGGVAVALVGLSLIHI